MLNVIDEEKPEGVIVQFGGQTPINLTRGLHAAGAPIWGTSPDSIDIAEDRVRFGGLLRELDIPHPDWGIGHFVGCSTTRGGPHRLSSASAPVVCAGRPRDGDRLR